MSWVDDFLSLYISSEIENHMKALELKRSHLPTKLYRYRSLKNKENIESEVCKGEIFLAPPSVMNDPYDSRSILGSYSPSVYIKNKKEFEKRFSKSMDKSTFDKIFNSNEWMDNLVQYIAGKYASTNEVEKAKSDVLRILMQQLEQLNLSINKVINETSRFACFTEKPTNLPMWSHYADGHTGICLEYNITSISNIYITNRLFPIRYVDKLPDGTSFLVHNRLPSYSFCDYFLAHKLKDWSYEKEWRLIYDVGSWYLRPEDVPADFWNHGKLIKFIMPSKVFLGAKISRIDEDTVKQWCEKAHISIEKMKCTEYGLIAE